MDHLQLLQIANRIHLGLMRELGQGIDVPQMLRSTLYARDVLLVCRAYPGSELQRLGQQFRQASAHAVAPAAARASGWRHDSSGFGVSKPAAAHAHSDFDDPGHFGDSMPASRQVVARRWLTPSTWFTR